MDFVEICNVCTRKVIIKAAKRIFNSDNIYCSYYDFYFGVTFLEHTVYQQLNVDRQNFRSPMYFNVMRPDPNVRSGSGAHFSFSYVVCFHHYFNPGCNSNGRWEAKALQRDSLHTEPDNACWERSRLSNAERVFFS